MPLSTETPAPVKAMPVRAPARARRHRRLQHRWLTSSKAGEEVVLRDRRVDRAAHPLEGLQRPRLRPEHLAQLEEPAVLRNLGSMRPHRTELLVDERADVQPGGDPVVGHRKGRRLAVGREPVLDTRSLHRLRHLSHQRFRKGGIVELARPVGLTTWKSLHVAGVVKGADRHPVRLDVVGVGVAAELVLGDHYLRPDPPHHLDQPSDRFVVRVRLDRQQTEGFPAHLPLRERTSWISCGTILWTSPTTPRSASLKMGASGSLLMAMIVLAPFIPTVCCIAPEIPSAM